MQKINIWGFLWLNRGIDENLHAVLDGSRAAVRLRAVYEGPVRPGGTGDADAQYQLGKCYKHGDGVEVNRKESAKWFRMAAENGHGDAPYCLNYVLRQLEAKE